MNPVALMPLTRACTAAASFVVATCAKTTGVFGNPVVSAWVTPACVTAVCRPACQRTPPIACEPDSMTM